MPLDSLDIHVLLWLQTPSSDNGLWAMTLQELAASGIASVHCKPNQLHKNQTENGSFFKYFSLGQCLGVTLWSVSHIAAYAKPVQTETKAIILMEQSVKVAPYIHEKVQDVYLIFLNHY